MDSQQLITSVIQKIATGPEFSKNISFEMAKSTMQAILSGEINNIQAAIFFIALRMKRETLEENEGILAAVLENTDIKQANVDDLIDLGDPYSGFERSVPISSFLPPLLAELGLPTVIHGLDRVSPKFGLTHRHINTALGLDVDNKVADARKHIENNNIGWAYIDQANYCANLHNLVSLRNNIVKRTVLNTVETLTAPLRAKNTHLVLGYAHKAYIHKYIDLTAFSGVQSSLLVSGVEGSVIPSLRQKSLIISYQDGEQKHLELDPKLLGINQNKRAMPLPQNDENIKNLSNYVAKLGKDALAGEKGMFYDSLVLSASTILWHMDKVNSIQDAAELIRSVLDSGKALERLHLH